MSTEADTGAGDSAGGLEELFESSVRYLSLMVVQKDGILRV